VSLLGIVADVLGILGFFGVSCQALAATPWLVWVFPSAFVIAFAMYSDCQRADQSFVRGDSALWTDQYQNLVRGKVRATCPICGGKVRLERPTGNSLEPTIGVCERNRKQHTFSFDPTTFSGSYREITYFHFFPNQGTWAIGAFFFADLGERSLTAAITAGATLMVGVVTFV